MAILLHYSSFFSSSKQKGHSKIFFLLLSGTFSDLTLKIDDQDGMDSGKKGFLLKYELRVDFFSYLLLLSICVFDLIFRFCLMVSTWVLRFQ